MKITKKQIVICSIIALFVIAFPTIYVTFGGLPYHDTGHDIEAITEYYQKIETEKVISCEWNLQNAHKYHLFALGPSVSVFYGYIVFEKDYITEISSKYDWKNAKPYFDYFEISHIKERYKIEDNNIVLSKTFAKHLANYTEAQSGIFLLDKTENKLYFEFYY